MRAIARTMALAATLALLANAAQAGTESTPTTADLLARAREHAAADRHGAAVRDYLAALAGDAALLPEIAREIAYQSLWGDDAASAARYFRRHLSLHPDQEDRDVREGLALALSWSGEQDEAIALYRELLASVPQDAGLRLGLGRSLIWDNQVTSGFRKTRAVEDDTASDIQAHRESARFVLTVLDGYETPWEMRADLSHDSDDLDILRLSAKATAEFSPSLLVQALPSRAWYDQGALPAITAWRWGAGLIAPLAPTWSLHAYGWIDRFGSDGPLPESGSAEPLRWTQPGGDLWLTWHAAPGVRWDFGGSALPVETLTALARETHLAQGSASLDWRLAPRWAVSAACSRASYSDDNRRWLTSARVIWRREGRVELSMAPVLTYLDYARAGIGYWSPTWMRNGSLEATIALRGERWLARASGRYGREKELGASAIGVGGVSARIARRLAPSVLVALEGGHSRSRLTSSSGYNRTFVGLSVRGFF